MTDDTIAIQDESNENLFANTDIAGLRSLAKMFRIKAENTWTKVDYIAAIQRQQKINDLLAEQSGSAATSSAPNDLAEGHARITIARDATAGAANSAIPLGLNGRTFIAPRGVPFDIPLQYIGVLTDAVTKTMRQKQEPSRENPTGVVVEEDILAYPFTVHAVRPGTKGFVSQLDQRAGKAQRKHAFLQEVGSYPRTDAELIEFERRKREDAIEEKKDKRYEASQAAAKAK